MGLGEPPSGGNPVRGGGTQGLGIVKPTREATRVQANSGNHEPTAAVT